LDTTVPVIAGGERCRWRSVIGRIYAQRLGPGALVGLPETLAAAEHGCRLRALGPLRALQLDGEALVDALEDDAASAVELLCALARHLRGGTR